jgi:hypothetical protein
MKPKTNSVWMSFEHLISSNLKLLAAVALAGGLATVASAQDSITVGDPSFEAGFNPSWPHYLTSLPMGGAWNVSMLNYGNNDDTGPFWDNGAAVDGTYVGFMQGDGLMGQPLSGFEPGQTYWIQFFANARTGTGNPVVAVYEAASIQGGAAIESGINITPAGGGAGSGAPFTMINVSFVAAATSGDLNIGKSSVGGADTTLLLDGFSIIRRSPNDVVIANPSFEASGTGQAFPGYLSAIAGWTLSGAGNGCAINQSSGPFADNGMIPDGGSVLVLQSGRSASQVLSVLPGMTYQLSLYLNARAASASPAAQVQIGGNTAYNGVVTAVGGSNPFSFLTYTFTATSANVSLVIANTSDSGTDSALLVDNVRVVQQPESINVANPSFENPPLPTGSGIGLGAIPGWNGGTGVNDATGPFWDNGAIVDGYNPAHVGFKQGGGLTGQPLSGFQVGANYWIQFFANARSEGGGGDSCDVSVFEAASSVGGAAIVSGINIAAVGGNNPFTFLNVPFTAAATNGDLNILNSPHTGGDATLLMDGFSVIRRTTNDIVIANPSFEASGTGQTSPGFAGEVAGWTLSGPGGPPLIDQTGGPYLDSGEVVPEGNNVLVIQGVCAYSQVLHGLTAGKGYRLTLYVNARSTGPQPTALITIDGKTAYNLPVPQLGSQPFQVISYDFTASAADVTLSLGNTTDGASYFVDDVRVYAPTPIAPTLTAQPTPASASRYAGLTLTLTAAVSGYPAPALQWQQNGNKISGATNATLVLAGLRATDAGSYVLTATNSAGGTNSGAVTLTVVPVTCSYASAVVAQNPLAYYRFSDGGGTSAYDYAGGNDAFDTNYLNNGGSGPATLLAGPQPPTFPGFETTNTAPFLDGVSQGYSSSVGLFNNRSNFTLMGWVNIDPSQYPLDSNPFTHPDGRASLFGQEWAAELGIYQGTNLYFYSTGINATIFANTNVAPGVWNFIAAVSDPAANTTTLYLNGAVVGTASTCPGTVNSYLMSIGKNVAYFPSGGYDNAFFPGSIDEVAAFDHALSASTIQAIYNLGLGLNSVNPSPTNLTFSVSGGQMTLGWPQDHTGWVLEAQTNALNAGLGTNWVRILSSATTNQVSVPINPANPGTFYRLVYP